VYRFHELILFLVFLKRQLQVQRRLSSQPPIAMPMTSLILIVFVKRRNNVFKP
jgi:hypothetical protein